MNDPLARTCAASVLAAIIAVAAWRLRALAVSGAVAAWLVGSVVAGAGGWLAGALLVVFFVTSSMLSRFGREPAVARRGSRRDAVQVAANGGVAAFCALMSALDAGNRGLWMAGLAGSIAAVTADTWATEIGRRSRSIPRSITSGKPVPRGTSGGVTALGTIGSVAGALLVAVISGAGAGASGLSDQPAAYGAAIALAGIAGSLADSLLGATVQAAYRCPSCGQISEREVDRCGQPGELVKGRGWIDNDLVNMAAALAGAAVAMALQAR